METKKMIFVLSPGRCGTKYLAALLGTVPGIHSRHEPKPDFVDVAERAQWDQEIARRFWMEEKLPSIYSVTEPIYAETSHVFINAFAGALLDLEVEADVIVLTRPHREVALSLWRRKSVPGRTKRGLDYLIHPDTLPLRGWRKLSDYQLCYWHCLEVERRSCIYTRRFKERGSRAPWTSLERITTQDEFIRLVADLSLPVPDWDLYDRCADQVMNASPEHYKRHFPDGDLDDMEHEVNDLSVS